MDLLNQSLFDGLVFILIVSEILGLLVESSRNLLPGEVLTLNWVRWRHFRQLFCITLAQ